MVRVILPRYTKVIEIAVNSLRRKYIYAVILVDLVMKENALSCFHGIMNLSKSIRELLSPGTTSFLPNSGSEHS